jgi:nucleotide-binding universal stress UspA family protein
VKSAASNTQTRRDTADAPASTPPHLENILVPTDFSAASRAGLDYALSLSAALQSHITVVHVIPLDFGDQEFSLINYPFPEARLRRQAEQHMRNWLKDAGVERDSLKSAIRIGRPVAEIIRAAGEFRADIIVLSTHGHTGLRHAFLGSTAERVVRHSLCPVLTVRAPGKPSPRVF